MFFQAEDGIRDAQESRGLGDVYKRQVQRAEIIREKGTDRSRFFRGEVDKYTWQDIGSSYLPSELTAAFLFAQLEEAEKIIAKRRNICLLYTSDAADDLLCVDLGGRRILKKKKTIKKAYTR